MKQKIKIMKHKPELSDEEIRSYMDFESLIAKKELASDALDKLYWVKRVVPVIAVTAIVTWFVFLRNTSEQPVEPIVERTEISPEPAVEEHIPSPLQQPLQEEAVKNEQSIPLKTPAGAERQAQPPVAPKVSPAEDVYLQAEPVEGYDNLYTYFNSQLVYPAESVKDSIQGVQTISFTINSDGTPEKIQVKQSLGEPFEREARRLIENMPAWKPATLNGKPVPSQMSLPLTFQILKVKAKE